MKNNPLAKKCSYGGTFLMMAGRIKDEKKGRGEGQKEDNSYLQHEYK